MEKSQDVVYPTRVYCIKAFYIIVKDRRVPVTDSDLPQIRDGVTVVFSSALHLLQGVWRYLITGVKRVSLLYAFSCAVIISFLLPRSETCRRQI